MYKQALIPDEYNHSIEIPVEFFGKKIEVTVVELDSLISKVHGIPPPGKKISKDQLMQHFGTDPDFPSLKEIRAKAWPSKW